ncbi:pyroglutamyl-peptidase 1 [Toxorhynchites rutilus septentrionalis]|uniref:pyroglutamyl-peptidase 1 n=1 Tax=Toxorhynchites rutilus septentrionalis TaxID=329112 RepID=UPI002478E69F|nr:pyroglutamyl-peptidase 1 [Toxorhynchites rutilus septentrionalis]
MSRTIFVTGFGPFAGHEERNASWEAVKLLPDRCSYKNVTYAIKKIQIPVTYEAVDDVVPKIWREHPTLVIHVGVHGRIETINLEKCSYTSGYCRPDFANKCLPCDKIKLRSVAGDDQCKLLETKLNLEAIADEIDTVKCCCSTEVGSYLCGYIYLKSLDINQERTLFIHVPDIDRPYSSEQTKNAIFQVLERCIWQLDANEKF